MQPVTIHSVIMATTYMMLFLALACIVLSILEKKYPMQKQLPEVPRWWGRSILSYAFRLVAVVYISYLYYATPWLRNAHIFSLGLYLSPFIGGIVGYLVEAFFDYWTHRFRHDSYKLWVVIHQFHHSPSRIQTITSFYKHPLENVIEVILAGIVSVTLLGLDPIGAAWVQFWVIFVNMIYHTNMKTPHWFGYLVQRPEMHLIHHARDVQYYNFADLPFWDILFKTFRNPKPAYPGPCGFAELAELRIKPMLEFQEVDPNTIEKTFQGDISAYLKKHDASETAPKAPLKGTVECLNIELLSYAERETETLNNAIEKITVERGFFVPDQITRTKQIQFLTEVKQIIEAFSEKIRTHTADDSVAPDVIDQFFSDLVNKVVAEYVNEDQWHDTIETFRKLLRGFVTEIIAKNPALYNQYVEKWKLLCKQHNLAIINVQFDVIGLFDSVHVYAVDSVIKYLNNLSGVDWSNLFERIFSKKSIRDRLFNVAQVFVQHAGSIDKLHGYLKNQLKNDAAIDELSKIYTVYLEGIERKLDLFRISYPRVLFNSSDYPMRKDVLAAEDRRQFIKNFLLGLENKIPAATAA